MTTITEVVEEVNIIKDEVLSAKQEKAEKIGQRSEQMKALKSFGVSNIDTAKKEINKLEKKSKMLEKKVITFFDKLKEKFEW